LSGSQNHDAIIKIQGYEVEQGFLESHYFVEITKAEEEYVEHLRRESLARYGFVFGGDNIQRVGSKRSGTDFIDSKPAVRDTSFPATNAVELVKRVLEKKNKKVYPSPCILIVEVQPERPLAFSEWAKLVNEVYNLVNRDKFWATYLIDWSQNIVVQV